MKLYGLIGRYISHSFSPSFFARKFAKEGIEGTQYKLFPLESIHDFPTLIEQQKNLCGLNVTIPYKEQIFEYLDVVTDEARAIGAVNTIAFRAGKLYGYNTDVYGFRESLRPLLGQNKQQNYQALILGTGGASKAVAYALNQLDIGFSYVSRQEKADWYQYRNIGDRIKDYKLIINTTPLGMSPNVDSKPDLDYDLLSKDHILYDLVYNPEKTVFLQEAEKRNCLSKNGLEMLHLQAEKAWKIWTT
ncbi:MAG: shikimate dehydrogenase [Saprospiraceae bacterium]|nr:shikimate dehydrogenase [Saprospiraceae bacterium]